jgi:hypothetical protein
MCQRPFRRATPTAYRLTAAGKGFRWTVEGEEAATAVLRDGTWDIIDAATDKADVTLVPVDFDGISRMAIVDHRGRSASTYTPTEGLIRDSHFEPLLLVRDDGPTGIHIVDRDGIVLALASAIEGGTGMDILITGAGAGERRRLLMGVTLALALADVASPTSIGRFRLT